MDERTELLIRDLASKLGVTAEHLWQILVTQAQIDGLFSLIFIIIFSLFTAWFACLVVKKTTKPKATDDCRYPNAEWEDDAVGWGFTFLAIFSVITIVLLFKYLPYAVSAIINPEYWAFRQIIK